MHQGHKKHSYTMCGMCAMAIPVVEFLRDFLAKNQVWSNEITPSPRVTRILVPGKDRVRRKPC